MTLAETFLAGVPGNPLEGLRRADRLWQAWKEKPLPIPDVVRESRELLGQVDADVAIAGGTLGILLGAALARSGWRVVLVERGELRGRDQEWNISRQELDAFLNLDLLAAEELHRAIPTAYNPARIQFAGGKEFWVRDVLNIGVDPVFLLETLKQKFLAAGGKLLEQTAFERATVHPDGVAIATSNGTLKARLLLDAMGHFSPIVRQVRQGQKPDGVCLVVGGCAKGAFPQNETGDIMVSFTPITHQCQYFWEAFPAKDGRTTYLFTYADAHPQRFSLAFFLEEYLRLLPEYQRVDLAQLQFQRVLFGFFPSYRNSPLRSPWNRILPVGDSSSNQSPLSFGGFGAMVRHLPRLHRGIHEALLYDALSQAALAQLHPYQPNLSVTWLFQRTMSVGVDQSLDPDAINKLMNAVFLAMEQLGDPVLKPFLQDVVQFGALSQTLSQMSVTYPNIVTRLIPQVGLPPLMDWMRHYLSLGVYSAACPAVKALQPLFHQLPPLGRYYGDRLIDALSYGSGADYRGHEAP